MLFLRLGLVNNVAFIWYISTEANMLSDVGEHCVKDTTEEEVLHHPSGFATVSLTLTWRALNVTDCMTK